MFRSDHPIAVVLTARRVGRIVFALVLVAGVAVLLGRLLATNEGGDARLTLAATWTIAAVAGLVAAQLVRAIGWQTRSENLFRSSMILPAIGMALLAPLTVHMVVSAAGVSSSDFDDWARMSLVAAGLAHGGFAVLVALRASNVIDGKRKPSIGAIFAFTVLLSLFPFGIYVLPPLIVAATGLPLAPAIRLIDWTIDRERALAAEPEALPRAVALDPDDRSAA